MQKQKQKLVFLIYNPQFSLMDPSPKPSMVLSLHMNKHNQKLFDASNNNQSHLHLLFLHIIPRLLHKHFATTFMDPTINSHIILSSILYDIYKNSTKFYQQQQFFTSNLANIKWLWFSIQFDVCTSWMHGFHWQNVWELEQALDLAQERVLGGLLDWVLPDLEHLLLQLMAKLQAGLHFSFLFFPDLLVL
jgi:hypothetical protein